MIPTENACAWMTDADNKVGTNKSTNVLNIVI
jgi:hypothetical protein